RLSLPILPDACAMFAPTMFALAGIAVVYTSLIALAQHDLKKMIAYSSVAHMGFVVLGIFSLTVEGIAGALMQMISHGLVVTALFIAIGLLYERRGSRNIDAFGGLALIMPRFALLLGIFVMAAIGLPGTSGFVGQALSLFGAWRAAPWAAAFGGIGIVLGAAYMLMLMSKTIFGFASGPLVKTMPDLHPRELAALVPLAAVILWLGVHPAPVLNVAAAPVEALVQHMETRLDIPEQLAKVEP
ncbi:MAG: proton-conducting transporter membrane subunit, partial [Pseudomonadota bacterium]|nr:proton-conducting transporter membrane subunit [Pseudomonadota bacterium]